MDNWQLAKVVNHELQYTINNFGWFTIEGLVPLAVWGGSRSVALIELAHQINKAMLAGNTPLANVLRQKRRQLL